MKMIPIAPDEAGAYCFHESTVTQLPAEMALWPDGMETDTFFEHNGMILPEVADIGGVPTVTGYMVNDEAWEAFCAQFPGGWPLPEDPAPAPQPTVEQVLDVLLGEVSL